jgi:hypothetical protein
MVSTQPPIKWIQEALSPGVKRPGREAEHLPVSSAEVKKTWIYTSIPLYAFMAYCLLRYSDNFTFTFYIYGSLFVESNKRFIKSRLL